MTTKTSAPTESLADRINSALDRAGVPPMNAGRTEWLVKKAHVSQGTASRWVNGLTTPSERHLRLLAKLTGVDYVWLATGHSGSNKIDEGLLAAVLEGVLLGATEQDSQADIVSMAARLYKRFSEDQRPHTIARDIAQGIMMERRS